MKRNRIVAAAVAALLAGVVGAASAQEVVRIGLSSPLSGGQAANGVDNRDGAQLAVDQINAKGGVKVGDRTVKLELVAQDDAADPRQGVQVAQKFADDKVRFVVGPYNSGVTMPAAKVYGEGGVLVATVSSNPAITATPQPLLFRVGPTDLQLGGKMGQYAGQDMKIKTVAVIDDRTAYGQGVVKEFVKEIEKHGIKVVSTQYTTDKATDFNAILTALRGARPDAVFFGGYSSQAGPMLRQMKSLGLNVPLLGGDTICSTETARLSGGGAENVLCTQGGGQLDKASKGQAFIADYKAAFKREPLTYAVAFYDGVHLFADAIAKAGSTEPAKVADVIAKGSFQGVAGEYSYDARHDLKNSAVTVYTFRNGQPAPLKSL